MSEKPAIAKNVNIDIEAGRSLAVPSEYSLKARELELSAGILGRLFGGAANAPLNIAGIVALLLVLTGIALLFMKAEMTPGEYWKIVVPILTLILGYLFGKKT